MADFKIKPSAGTGNKLLVQSQDQSGSSYAIQVGDAGATTLTNATITAGTFPTGHPIKQSFYSIGEGTTATTAFPSDDTTPQRSEGVEIFSQAYTPTASASDIYIRANVKLCETSSAVNAMALGLFISTQDDVLVVFQGCEESDNGGNIVNYLHCFIDYKMANWGASARTFSLRCSSAQAYNYFDEHNTYAIGSRFNNKITSSVIITEVS